MKAKERGAKIIHVDPRFTRTSAMAHEFIALRSGSDIAFLGGIIKWVLDNERYFKEYVVAYTNASSIVNEAFRDTEDLDGLFSGYTGADTGTSEMAHMGGGEGRGTAGGYDPSTWGFERNEDGTLKRDETLTHPRCVLQVLKRHYSRYTPEMVERVCGVPQDRFLQLCETLAENSGRERTTAFAYAVGWTQHTVGVQYIRTAAILQLLLGNIGRPGGGIMALRGHADIQGATDIATLYDLLPGYLPMPSIRRKEQTLDEYLKTNTKTTGWWSNFPKYFISQLKAFFGEHATQENDFCFEYLPQLTGDHSTIPMTFAMKDGTIEGYFVVGQNPVTSGQNTALIAAAMDRLKWFVNVDAFENETSSYWKREGADPAEIGTECFFIPAAMVLEKDGTMTNTNRMLQFHDKAIEPPDEATSDAWFFYNLGKCVKALYADSTDPKDRPIQHLTWDYEHEDPHERKRGEPSVRKIMQEINGFDVTTGEQLKLFTGCKDDGSTACGGWIYSGAAPDKQTLRSRSRTADEWTSLQWGFAWPANRRILYNRASADPDGNPWSERKKYVWWSEEDRAWNGVDIPDFPTNKPPDTQARPGAGGVDAHSGSDPFIMQLDGRAQLFVASGLKDGPLPSHYEPLASVTRNPLYRQQSNPSAGRWHRRDNPHNEKVNPKYPYVLTTYRITELSGVYTRYVPWLAELQPEAFCEIDPELAASLGVRSGDYVTIATAVNEIEARALVTSRMRPLTIEGKLVHQIGLPYLYGNYGFTKGDTSGDLIPFSIDPNVSIHESKTLTCNLRAGRRAARTGDTVHDAPVPHHERNPSGQPKLHGRDHHT